LGQTKSHWNHSNQHNRRGDGPRQCNGYRRRNQSRRGGAEIQEINKIKEKEYMYMNQDQLYIPDKPMDGNYQSKPIYNCDFPLARENSNLQSRGGKRAYDLNRPQNDGVNSQNSHFDSSNQQKNYSPRDSLENSSDPPTVGYCVNNSQKNPTTIFLLFSDRMKMERWFSMIWLFD
jgi:hypothetical protein